ncbi:tyrosyl-tRNA synthetase like protein [Babesia gibsoni]|uniref:tyrosine--tRNA ligase n=1 Tax=Babesia gibsoni TaxID=33632 RepID=A0AAD8LLZ6_BABGI|nr:tyrosyl-tRNA synthetase like protein [Babesia gibsoni]
MLGSYIAIFSLLSQVTPSEAFHIGAVSPTTHLYNNYKATSPAHRSGLSRKNGCPSYSSLPCSREGVFNTQGKAVKSHCLSQLVERGVISQATDLQKLDEFLCSSEALNMRAKGQIPAVYYGIDLTNNFIHEGTLLQLLVLRRFLAHKFNVVIILGGGTTTVGDPSFRSRRSKASITSYDEGSNEKSVILDQECWFPNHSEENELAILNIVAKVLTKPIELDGGNKLVPSLSFASKLDKEDIDKITSNSFNVVVVNNRDLYDTVKLSEYLGTVANNTSVGRMLSRDSLKSRMSCKDGDDKKLQVNMSLAELMYMSLQAMDFVHVAAKYNAVIQLGGSDQMGNIVSGVDLSRSLGDAGKTLFGITTPLLQTPSGEKISKSVGESLIKITTETRALPFWSHFRSVDDAVVGDYLRWLTSVPLSSIQETLSKHVNEGKVLLADELTTTVFGKEYTDAIHKYWLSSDSTTMTMPAGKCSPHDYDSFVKFTECAPSITLRREQLNDGIEFGDMLDQLRTPQMVSGFFHSNRRAIREGSCRINGSLVTSVNHKITPEDFIHITSEDERSLYYVTLSFGKRQIYFVKLEET